MTDTPNFRALCAELVATWDKDYPWDYVDDPDLMGALLDRARAALATPPPEPPKPPKRPTEQEVADMTEELTWKRLPQDDGSTDSFLLDVVNAALERWGR